MLKSPESGYSDQSDDDQVDRNEKKAKRKKSLLDVQQLVRSHSEPEITMWNELHPNPNEKGECSKKTKTRKGKKRLGKAETAEDMFNRLLNLGHVDTDVSEESDDEAESEIDEEPLVQKVVVPEVPKPTQEELFNQKREARLKRMEELSSKIDTFDVSKLGALSENDLQQPSSSSCLSQSEKELLERRAARLERLEKEAKEFKNRLSQTLNRGSEMLEKINDIKIDQRKAKAVPDEQPTCPSKTVEPTNDDEFEEYFKNLNLDGVNEEEIAREIEELMNFGSEPSAPVVPLEGVNEQEIINEIENLLQSDIILEEDEALSDSDGDS
jgi:hypothetical protein